MNRNEAITAKEALRHCKGLLENGSYNPLKLKAITKPQVDGSIKLSDKEHIINLIEITETWELFQGLGYDLSFLESNEPLVNGSEIYNPSFWNWSYGTTGR